MSQYKLSAYWIESMSQRSIINASAVANFSVRVCSFFKTSATRRCEKNLPPNHKSMQLRLLKINFLALWKSISRKLVTWDEDDGAGKRHKDKDEGRWQPMSYGTVPASMAGLRLRQRQRPPWHCWHRFGQRVYIIFSKCEKILMGKLNFCSSPSCLLHAEHKDFDIRFDYFKHLRSWETKVMHSYLGQSTCPESTTCKWRIHVCASL